MTKEEMIKKISQASNTVIKEHGQLKSDKQNTKEHKQNAKK